MQDLRMSKDEIKQAIVSKLHRHYGCGISDATGEQLFGVLASTVRDEVMNRRAMSRGERKRQKAKKLYYLSAEFLVGRALHNNMVSLVNEQAYREALLELGVSAEAIFEQEPEPGLGNGGLGRLAACFLDSLSSLRLPAMGLTIRYEYGLFRQHIVGGYQVELPDDWLVDGNIWEIYRPDQAVDVRFGGYVEHYRENGRDLYRLVDYTTVQAVPYDMPVLGYDSVMVNMLRTWSARSTKTLDMSEFSRGQYTQAIAEKELVEIISKVLYPEDNHAKGKELRLKQQYFLASASVQYAINDYENTYGGDWAGIPDKMVIHINDTHPSIAIPEMMRILIDEKGLTWEGADAIVRRTFAYTNHTVLAEALEKWPEDMMRTLLPRIYMILKEMNRRLGESLWQAYPGQWERIGQMSIIAYGQVHMANLCVAYCEVVNGVSRIHAEILKRQTFRDYYNLKPDKFIGITNGITHRRWLMSANGGLAALLDEAIGAAWRTHPDQLQKLMPLAGDAAFQDRFAAVKADNKRRLAQYLLAAQGAQIDPQTLFDVQAKRLHEYKRQLMNALRILILYNRIVDDPNLDLPPRTFIFGAKASPGYYRAKLIIKLIHAVADLVARHPRASSMIRVVFLSNYSVSAAEALIPAADLSEQISTAGKEASGTGNMKFMMNGALTIGTMDGANVEIAAAVGPENIYIFGLSAEEVEHAYQTGSYRASETYETNFEVRRAMEQLISGALSPDNPRLFQDLYHALLFGDHGMADPYFVLKDLPGYLLSQQAAALEYQDRRLWLKKAIVNTAQSGVFASDRSISEYNERIWHLTPLQL
ncbi:MAG: glycogen/starch/alpha-glucan phosphorylase [Clostridiales bacterium]|nr:glycogen/starch/alpha-glucan phosphorylase [Clostridiales bacterium]